MKRTGEPKSAAKDKAAKSPPVKSRAMAADTPAPYARAAAAREPSARQDASADVIERIKAMIKFGALAPGDKLHSEIRFATELGISRSSVTKAYAKLEAYGLIRTIPQSGTYLAAIGPDAMMPLLSNVMETNAVNVGVDDLDALYGVRAVLEEMLAVSAVESADDAGLQRLREKTAQVKKRILEQNGTIEDDLVFHMEIAELSGRPFFKSLLFFITLPMVQMFRSFEKQKRSSAVRERWVHSMAEHDEIVAAICARDAERTRRAVRDHFQKSIAFRTGVMANGSGKRG
jgi:GntR family transcriptional repressor for pyruvate dehydrogenase complex